MLLRPLLQRRLPLCVVLLSTSRLLQRGRPTPLCVVPVVAAAAGRMGSSRAGDDERAENLGSSNTKVARIQALLAEDSKGGWEKCWEEGFTPWDVGSPTPVILHLLQRGAIPKGRTLVPGCGSCWEEGFTPWDIRSSTPVILHLLQRGALPKGRTLVPGCGRGHDVVAMACPERFVVGLDISESAIKKACELTSTLPNKNCFTFLAEDFFAWRPDELFDLIFDYTFFCAIDPCMRSAWANQIRDILKPDGGLITLMFPVGDFAGGPPYAVSVSDYETVLNPLGFQAVSVTDNELAIEPRKGREKLGRWRRKSTQSLM